MENKMAEVAKLLGVELNEEFRLNNSNFIYKVTKYGLFKRYIDDTQWRGSSILEDLLLGKITIIKIFKPILDDVEKRYLSNIIKPFRDRVVYITKVNLSNKKEYIIIELNNCEVITLPFFVPGSMYKGMENDKDYTLKDLGL